MEPFSLEDYREAIAQVTEAVFDTMLSDSVRLVAAPDAELATNFTGAVCYTGRWQGALVLDCRQEQAARWAERLMPITPPATVEDALDGLGELTNVIAGNLKPALPSGVVLSIPSVIEGADYRLKICGGNIHETLYFEDEMGQFRVTLVQVVEEQRV